LQLRTPTSETDPEQAEFDREADYGSLYVGSPETVSRRIAATAKALGISRFDMKYSAGGLSHERILRCIRLYGEKVIPLAREMLAADGNRGR
jgi:alkanesulfonate monooxygenase SsuD/methylene tetrahydromethanopterin reductase-like flavin-dependent oxidoreductase (luciferase family)